MPFKSQVAALSELVADTITGATIIGGSVTGALIQTASAGARWVMGVAGNLNYLYAYSNDPDEVAPGFLSNVNPLAGRARMYLQGSDLGTGDVPQVMLESRDNAAPYMSLAAQGTGAYSGQGRIDLQTAQLGLPGAAVPLEGIEYGTATVTIPTGAASGNLTIPHGIGKAPRMALVCTATTTFYLASINSTNASQIVVTAFTRTGATVGSPANVPVHYLILR